MKNKFFAVVAIAALAFAVSCKSGGMSEETKNKMTTFETDWNTMKQGMTDWGTTMNTKMEEMHKMMNDAMPMEGDMAMHGDMKMDHMGMMEGTDSATVMCNMIMMEMESMKAAYKAGMDSVTAQSDQYAAWKKSSMEAKDEDATSKGLDEWNAKLAANNTMMTEWNNQLSEMETNCKNVCDMMMKDMEMHSDMKKK